MLVSEGCTVAMSTELIVLASPHTKDEGSSMLIHFVFQLSAQTQRPLRLLGFLSNSHNRRDAAYAEVAQRIE